MKKKTVILLLIILAFISIYTTDNNKKDTVNNKIYKMYLENDSGEYELSNSKSFPTDGYALDTNKSSCSNGGKVKQNENLSISVNITSSTSCTLYFRQVPTLATKKILSLVKDADTTSTDKIGDTGLAYDGTSDNNLRYVGANPNNYVTFNNEEAGWRIIGVFNNIDDGTGKIEQRIKIVKDKTIGSYEWNSNGTNDWTASALQEMLNNSYLSKIESTSQSFIGDTLWKIGRYPKIAGSNLGTSKKFYEFERSNETYGDSPTSWIGKIALEYVSDYGYAAETSECRNKTQLIGGKNFNYESSGCEKINWLNKLCYIWFLNTYSENNFQVAHTNDAGSVGTMMSVNATNNIFPTLYLKSSVKIIFGNGTSSNPYILGN